MRPPPLERDGGVSLRRGLRGARGAAPPAPIARPLLAHYACLPRGHGAAPDDPRWEEGVLQVLRETPRQVPVRVGVLLSRGLQSAIHDTEGGSEVLARARGRGGAVALCRTSHRCTRAAALRGSRRSCSSPHQTPLATVAGHPLGGGPLPPPRHAAPTGHAGQRGSDGLPHPHARGHSMWVTDPNSPPSAWAVGGGGAPDLRRPSQRLKAPPPGKAFCHPHSEQRRPARAHAVEPVLGPHARTDRTRNTRVAVPRLPAPGEGRSGEGPRLTPDAPHNSGRRPPPGTAPHHPRGTQPPHGVQAKPGREEAGPDRPPPSTPDGARDRGRTRGGAQTTWNGPTSAQCRDRATCARHTTQGGGAEAAGARAHTHAKGTWGLPEGQPDRARGTHRPRGMAYQ